MMRENEDNRHARGKKDERFSVGAVSNSENLKEWWARPVLYDQGVRPLQTRCPVWVSEISFHGIGSEMQLNDASNEIEKLQIARIIWKGSNIVARLKVKHRLEQNCAVINGNWNGSWYYENIWM